MTPVRKKSVNKRFLGEASPVKEVRNSTMARKKKSCKLGPPWTTKELRQFYKAYRLHGKSWKKVAAEIRNRSVEMVEALFNLNRAYLSLPEGTASIDGLVAMMTDHYSALEEIESEGDGSPELVQRPKKQKLDRIERSTSSAGLKQFCLSASVDGCLSLVKKASPFVAHPRAVGKRTPRIPVLSLRNKDGVNSASIKEKGQQSDMEDHVVASQRGYSPRDVKILSRKELSEDGFGNKGVNSDANGYHPRATTSSNGFEGVDTVGSLRKRKKFYERKVGAKENGTIFSDNENEACRGTEMKRCTTLLGCATPEVLSSKSNKSPRVGERKRCKEIPSPGEFLDLDALQTLADIAVRESESNCGLEEDRDTFDRNDKSDISEATPGGREKEVSVEDELLSSFQNVQGGLSKKQKFERNSANFKPAPEAKQRLQSIEHNSSESNIKDVQSEVSNEDETKSSSKVRQSDLPRQSKPTLAMDGALTAEQMKISTSIDEPTEFFSVSNQVISSTGRRSRIKADMKRRAVMHKEGGSSKKILKNDSDKQLNLLNDRELDLEEKLSCCLSSPMVRRWCSYEWFYNAIDYPWFANEEFVEYLNHVGLGHIPQLTRVEWGVIKSSLGKPRRFSHHFLHEEREKLKQYRESVRTHYAELRSGARDGLPTDLAKPLSVGQRVTAFHPKRREMCDGSVLAVECGRYMLQFDCPQMAVEFVEDIDCMPLNPMDNMPEALRTERLQVSEHSISRLASSWQQENGPSPLKTLSSHPKTDELHSVPRTKEVGIDVVTTQHGSSSQNIVTQISTEEVNRKNGPGLTSSYDAQVSSVPPSSRQYSLHTEFIWHPWLKTDSSSTYVCGTQSYSNGSSHYESESMANDIIRTSRLKAGAMVDAAIHAFSRGDKEEAPYLRTLKALDSVDSSTSQAEPMMPFIESAVDVNGSSHSHHNQPSNNTSEPNVNADPLESHNGWDRIEALIPSELIKSCVTSLQTIQTCSQTRYPHADVAQAIESALASLRPCSPENLSLYHDIQKHMGIIKRQIFSMVPA